MANKYDHDITHCKGINCEKKNTCYRYLAYEEVLNTKKSGIVSFFLNNKKACINNNFSYYSKLQDGEQKNQKCYYSNI